MILLREEPSAVNTLRDTTFCAQGTTRPRFSVFDYMSRFGGVLDDVVGGPGLASDLTNATMPVVPAVALSTIHPSRIDAIVPPHCPVE